MYYPWIYVKGGIERTILEIANRSRHDWTVLTSHYRPEDTFPGFKDIEVRQCGSVSVRRDVASVARACAQLLLRPGNWDGFDALMISCDGIGNLLAMRPRGIPLLCLCHTPLKISYDSHARERWLQLFKPGLLTRAAVSLFTRVDRLAWRRYRRVFCVSREVERRLRTAGVVAPGQTEVVHPGIDVGRLAPTGRREPFFLIPGRIMWSKNIELGIRAFMDFKSRSDDPTVRESRLVVAGMVDEKSRSYFSRLQDLTSGRGDVEFVVCPSDEQLYDLYDRSFAVLFTPPNEDWGIVPLEAMAFGKPVIAVERGGPAESVVHEETGFLCADQPAAFAEAMTDLVTQPMLYERLSKAARKRAEGYDWDSFVGRIDEYLDDLAVATARHRPLAVRDAHRI
jgi:glycosyltransferase involved in cell wall biosynthesis